MQEINGYVEHIIYRNDENGYTVMEFATEDKDGDEYLVTCVGAFTFIGEGSRFLLRGNVISHPTYGEQFKVETYEEGAIDDSVSMQRYLASGVIKGIGGGLAKRIVDMFGDDTFDVMEKEPEKLAKVKGISKKKAIDIATQFAEKVEMRRALIYLQNYGISNKLAIRIYSTYKENMYNILSSNPYRLAEDIRGVGFKIADAIAMKMGISYDSEKRVRAGIFYALEMGMNEGHMYLPEKRLCQICVELVGVSLDAVMDVLDDMDFNKDIIRKEDGVYLPVAFYEELNTAARIVDIAAISSKKAADAKEEIEAYCEDEELEVNENQIDAVNEALNNGLIVITGGPGTGKTTTVNLIIKMFEKRGMNVLLAAPTGRAAKRLSETTAREAQTIHRLLGYNPAKNDTEDLGAVMNKSDGLFEKNEWNQLETDVIIIDEMSMVDMFLFAALTKAVAIGTKLILVGDVNQLPSVGPGNVLKDIINSGVCRVIRLDKVFRQAQKSDIVTNAHKINAGEQISLDNKSMDFFCLEKNNPHDILEVVIWLVRDKMPKYTDSSVSEVQVLVPMKKGELGVTRCNEILQRYLNPKSYDKAEMNSHGVLFREGDKVMQIKNNYQIEWKIYGYNNIVIEEGTGVFNGDVGMIKEIRNHEKEVVIAFDDDKYVIYPFENMDEIELAYAITIHKSQGSEYPAVVMPLLDGPRVLMNRNLLYTAVTRGKKCVTIVGLPQTVRNMIENESEQKRYSTLKKRLNELQN